MNQDEKFRDATERVKQLSSRPSNEILLDLYGLFKQATEGDVLGKRPGMLNFKERAKFDAWTTRKGLSKQQASDRYIQLVDSLLDKDKKGA